MTTVAFLLLGAVLVYYRRLIGGIVFAVLALITAIVASNPPTKAELAAREELSAHTDKVSVASLRMDRDTGVITVEVKNDTPMRLNNLYFECVAVVSGRKYASDTREAEGQFPANTTASVRVQLASSFVDSTEFGATQCRPRFRFDRIDALKNNVILTETPKDEALKQIEFGYASKMDSNSRLYLMARVFNPGSGFKITSVLIQCHAMKSYPSSGTYYSPVSYSKSIQIDVGGRGGEGLFQTEISNIDLRAGQSARAVCWLIDINGKKEL